MTITSIVFVAYLLLVMIVGAVASRYGRTMEGYFLADRGLGSWVTAISSVASSESGWLVLGLVGMAYVWGAQAVWTVPGVLLWGMSATGTSSRRAYGSSPRSWVRSQFPDTWRPASRIAGGFSGRLGS